MAKTNQASIRMPDDLRAQIKGAAALTCRSFTGMIIHILREYFRRLID